jgi:hypothetical protein
MRNLAGVAVVGLVLTVLVGCGGGEEKSEESEAPNPVAQAACNGTSLADAPKLPAGFPQVEHVTYTTQRTDGPTDVVEGYFEGDLKDAYDEYKKELEAAGYKVLFDEIEEHDSEVSWSGEGRTGQVALREDCGGDRIYVHITNRPA